MQVILPVLYALFFIFLIYKINFFELSSISRNAIVAVFIFKIIAGTILWWLYTYHYPGADLLDYFNDGKKLFDLLWSDPHLLVQVIFNGASYPSLHSWNDSFEHVLYNDAHTMILLNMVLHFFSFGSFHVHTVCMCFVSLTGLTALYKTFLPYFKEGKKMLFVSIFLIPSVLFWSSGVLKEGLLLFGLGMFLYSINCGLQVGYSWKRMSAVLFSFLILLLVKFYVLIALLPGLMLNRWVSLTSTKLLIVKYVSVLVGCLCLASVMPVIHRDYDPLKIIAEKQAKAISESYGGTFLENDQHFICIDYEKRKEFLQPVGDSVYVIKSGSTYLQWDQNNMQDTTFVNGSTDTAKYKLVYEVVPANTRLELDRLQPTFYSLFTHAPTAFLNVLIQPLLWKAKGFVQLLPALENIFFIGLLIFTILFFNKRVENASMIVFCFSFVLILYVLIGITTPAIGAIIRYKVPALPFLCIALLLLMDKKKIVAAFPSVTKLLE